MPAEFNAWIRLRLYSVPPVIGPSRSGTIKRCMLAVSGWRQEELAVEEGVGPEREGAHARTQGLVEAVDPGKRDTWVTLPDEDRTYRDVQVVEEAGAQELRNRRASSFNENAAQTTLS